MIATSSVSIVNVNDGATGATGPQGVSVTKVVEEYRLSNSNTELTGSGTGYTWSETKPDIPSGKYLWIRERTDLSNNTSSYGTAHCDIVISGLVQDVDRNSNAITSKVWESDITTKINEYDGSTGAAIRNRVSQTETNISGITSRVSDVESETDSLGTRMTSAESSITQNANNIALKVSQDGVISAINQSAESILISASKVDIQGAVSFSSLDSTLQGRITGVESTASTANNTANTANATANTALKGMKVYSGTCSTAAGTAAKVVSCSDTDFEMTNGTTITVKFSNASTVASPTLNVNSKGAKAIYLDGAEVSSSNILRWQAGSVITFQYDGAHWVVMAYQNLDYFVCSTAAGTTAKATNSVTGTFVLCKGTTITVFFGTSNSVNAPTLNVGSTGAYAIYYKNAVTSASNQYLWSANTTVNFTFNGSYWYVNDGGAQLAKDYAKTAVDWVGTNGSTVVTAANIMKTWTDDATLATTTIDGGYIKTHTIESTHLATNAIMSQNYTGLDNSHFSSEGSYLDLSTGNFYTPKFGVSAEGQGGAYINGEVVATSGRFGNDTSYWNIATVYDYNSQPHASLVGTGSPYLQTGNWQVSDNAVATRKYTSTSESAGNATYYKDSDTNTFYDVGIKIPTDFSSTAATNDVGRYNKAFYYGRKYTGNNPPTIEGNWVYFYMLDTSGNLKTAGTITTGGDIYEGGTKLSEKYAAISDVGSVYLPKTGGTITGNLTVNGSFTTNLQLQTNLGSTSSAQLTGAANAVVKPGVTGTLGVGNGGTGQTTAQNAANAFINALSTGSTTSMLRDADYFISQYIGGGTSNTKYYRRPISTIWDYIEDKIETTYDITNTYRRLDDNDFDTINVTDLTAGNLIVNGAARFTNDVFADTFTGNLVGTASNAVKVGNNLVIKLNGGSTEGTNLFTYNGSAAKTINITASSIGAQASGTYAGGISNGGAASKLAYQAGNEINFVTTASTPPYQVHFNWRNGYTNTQTGTSSDIQYYFENYNGEYNHTTLYAAQFSGNAATATTATTADKVGNNLVILFNSGSTEGTNKFTYNGSAAKNVNITKSSIGLGNVDNTADANKTVKEAGKVTNTLKIQLNGGTTEGTNQFSYDGSAVKNINITKSSVGLGNVENTALSTWAGSANLTTTKVGTLAAAAAKGVDTSIGAASTSVNLPTSAAVAAFVEGKGYATSTEVTTFVEGKGYVTSSGVTSVRVQATSPVVSSVNTAQSSTLNTTISLADGYGDTKNPYGTKTKNYILAGPGSGSAAAPTFRALVADDIPTLTPAKAGLGNVTNNKQVKGLSSGTTSGHLVFWGSDGYTVADSGLTATSVATKITLAGSDYSASSNTITITQANLQNAVQSTGLLLMTSAERSKLASIQVSEGGTIDFSGVTASTPLTATVGTNKTVNITHNTSGVTAGTYRSVTVNTYGHVTAGTNPTTLSGYGITDAKIASGVITLGSNTITPLTASSTLDATKLSGTASISTTGNAATATTASKADKLTTGRTISLTGDVTGSTTFDGSSNVSITATVADNSHYHTVTNITTGDSSVQGSLDPITVTMIGSAASNKTFGLPANAITIQYSTNGGSTWTDYGASDAQKKALFAETRGFGPILGKSSSASTNTVNNQLRVIIEPTDRYVSLHGIYVWMSSNGNTCVMDLERSTIGAKDTFTSVFANQPISGWSGNNIRYFSSGTFGGGASQTSNFYKYRITFKQTAVNTSYNSAQIIDIRFIGNNVWSSPNTMVSKNHMYSWDENLNVTFPANITATTFTGALSGNATTATKLSASKTINGTSFDGSENITTANWGTSRNIKIGNTQKTVNGSANYTWTPTEINRVTLGYHQDHQRVVIALCELSAQNTGIYSDWHGKIYRVRDNGLVPDYYCDIDANASYGITYGFYYNFISNYENNSLNALSGEGYRACVFKYNNKYYGGLEFYQVQAATFYMNGVGEFTPFIVCYYNQNTSAVLNTEINNSMTYSTSQCIRDHSCGIFDGSFTGNLTGNASTATSATTASNLSGFTNTTTSATAIDSATQNGHVYVNGTSGIYNQSDGAAFVQAYSASWVAQIYQDYRTGQIALRGKNNGTWQSWRKVLDSTNYTDYTVTKTGTGASGSWGISVTGNAATSTKWASAQTVYVALGTASKTTSIQGGSSSAVTLGVDGVLGVANGGTGASSFTANSVIMSGSSTTGAFTTRAVTNNTSASAVTANTNLITANTLAYWTGSSNLTTCNQGTFGTAATYSATTSVTSGSSALVTSGGVSTALGSYVTLSTTQTISGAKTFSAATSFTNTTASTSKSTGAVKVSGGLGVAGQVSANTAMIGDAVSLVYDSSISALCFQFA